MIFTFIMFILSPAFLLFSGRKLSFRRKSADVSDANSNQLGGSWIIMQVAVIIFISLDLIKY